MTCETEIPIANILWSSMIKHVYMNLYICIYIYNIYIYIYIYIYIHAWKLSYSGEKTMPLSKTFFQYFEKAILKTKE